MLKCVIFDCDGTLVDSEYLCNLGLELKLREYGVEVLAADLVDRFRGHKLSTILDVIEVENEINVESDFVTSYRSLVDQLFEERLEPCVGVTEMLDEVALPKCVPSNGPIEKIQKALSITEIAHHFNDKLFSSYDIGSWKPDPKIFLYAADKMQCKPDECIVVEDSLVGIQAAKAAGMQAILYDPHHSYDESSEVGRIHHMSVLSGTIANL